MRSTRSLSWIERALGSAPRPVPPHVFYLGSEVVHYARVELEGGVRLVDARSVTLPEETFHVGQLGGPLRDEEAFAAALRELTDGVEDLESASLVLPDHWYRLVFAEVDKLPRAAEARDEALRWKLKRLVPFRVEDLRIDAVEAAPLQGQEEPERIMLGFAIEALVGPCEKAFADLGIQLGVVTNVTLSVAHLVDPVADGEIGVLVIAQDQGYSLLASLGASPVLYRYKALEGGSSMSAMQVEREMRLTSRFLEERLGEGAVSRVVVVGSDEWPAVVGDSLGIAPSTVDASAWQGASGALQTALRVAIVGAAHREVA